VARSSTTWAMGMALKATSSFIRAVRCQTSDSITFEFETPMGKFQRHTSSVELDVRGLAPAEPGPRRRPGANHLGLHRRPPPRESARQHGGTNRHDRKLRDRVS